MYSATYSWPRHYMEVSGQFHAPFALLPGKDWIGDWVGPRAGLDMESKEKIPSPRRNLTPIIRSFNPYPVAIDTELSWLVINLITLAENCNWESLYNKLGCHVMSEVFSISKNTAAVNMLLKFKVTLSVSLVHWSVVLWRARKPNWFAGIKIYISTCL
jgi:hypothetical protein